jgi:hypothetical protein
MNWLLILKIKCGQRPDGKRGPGSFACGGKDFSVLIFWLLLYQDKSNSPPRQLSGPMLSFITKYFDARHPGY